ncbi:MAG: tetraacyldisaccharide 4'-kinase [Candidatus Omnitrophica bacterium]|nr:tetraacyldisaccharide 4'-kinase [Candidatus Omnitrophota bacterium]
MRKYLYNLATDGKNGVVAGVCKFLLFLLSLVYGFIIRCLSAVQLANPKQLGMKIISVGNITLGGTGKTVLVEYLVRYLRQKNILTAVVSRGFKGADEPDMLRLKLKDTPVIVDKDRARGVQKAAADYRARAVIFDDGFQQWKIKKDLDIVMIDATNPFGNQHMLPRGILREPLSSLKRAGVFVLSKINLNPNIEDIEEFLLDINKDALIVESIHRPVDLAGLGNEDNRLSLGVLKDKSVSLFCGIGDPGSFEAIARESGAVVAAFFTFPDHHAYSQNDLEDVIRQSENKNVEFILTTEKDAARINNSKLKISSSKIFSLRIELEITKNEEGFHSRLLRSCGF